MIIAIANHKGGVAKTTSAHNISAALAQQGKRVLIIDLDSQASLTISVGLEPLSIEKNIVSAMAKNGESIKACIHEAGIISIVPSIIDLAAMEIELLSRASREKILDRVLAPVKDEFDYIIIDCPPQLGILTINALSCADGVIIPVKTDYLAYRGLTQLTDSIREIQDLINPSLKILGVIATMFESRVKDDCEILKNIRSEYTLLSIIKKMVIVKKGIYDGMSVVELAPGSEAAVAYKKIAGMIIDNRYEGDVSYADKQI